MMPTKKTMLEVKGSIVNQKKFFHYTYYEPTL